MNKKFLIIPLCGTSSRFSEFKKPKWLLTMFDGKLMIQHAILNNKIFDKVIFICLEEHIEKYNLYEVFKKLFSFDFQIIKIQKSISQPHTIIQGLEILLKETSDFSFLIKDCDNTFDITTFSEDTFYTNFICYGKIGIDFNNGDIENKSYITLNEFGFVNNIVEKKIISDSFCAGGYFFYSALEFKKTYSLLETLNLISEDTYISHIIYQMLLRNKDFVGVRIKNYVDWGTAKEYKKYNKNFATIFIDIDGTLVKNSSEFFTPIWGTTDSINLNVEYLRKLFFENRIQIILTTSRTKDFEKQTIEQLKELNIPYTQIIFGLWHAKRILINDYSDSNSYRSADSINLKRNSEDLKVMLEGLI